MIRRWSKEDCKLLLALKAQTNPKLTNKEIGERFGVSPKAAAVKIVKLAHVAQQTTPKKRGYVRWTPEEDENLIERREQRKEAFSQIGRALNRPSWDCKQHYCSLGRSSSPPPSPAAYQPKPSDFRSRLTTRMRASLAFTEIRNEPLRYANPFGELLGEPPIGRSALDKRNAGAGA